MYSGTYNSHRHSPLKQLTPATVAATRAAFRRAFERDKEDLREMGIPIVMMAALTGLVWGAGPASPPPAAKSAAAGAGASVIGRG